MQAKVLVIACGAIARELVKIKELNGWVHFEFQCLPPELRNTPDKFPQRSGNPPSRRLAAVKKYLLFTPTAGRAV